jgi:hypothetical protein
VRLARGASGHPAPGMRLFWRPAPWHLALPPTAPPQRAPEFLVTGLPCPGCACPVWLASTATDQEFRWFGRLFTAGADDQYLLMCSDCGGTMTAPSAKVTELNSSLVSDHERAP